MTISKSWNFPYSPRKACEPPPGCQDKASVYGPRSNTRCGENASGGAGNVQWGATTRLPGSAGHSHHDEASKCITSYSPPPTLLLLPHLTPTKLLGGAVTLFVCLLVGLFTSKSMIFPRLVLFTIWGGRSITKPAENTLLLSKINSYINL